MPIPPVSLIEAARHIDDFGPFLNRQLIDRSQLNQTLSQSKQASHDLLTEAMSDETALKNFIAFIHSPSLGLVSHGLSPSMMLRIFRECSNLDGLFYGIKVTLSSIFEKTYYEHLPRKNLDIVAATQGGTDGVMGGFFNFMNFVLGLLVNIFDLTKNDRPNVLDKSEWKAYGERVSDILHNSFNLVKNFSLLHKDILIKFYEMNNIFFKSLKDTYYPFNSNYFQLKENSEQKLALMPQAEMIQDIHNQSISNPTISSFGNGSRPMLRTDVQGCPVMEIYTPALDIETENSQPVTIGGESLGKESFDWACDLIDQTFLRHLDEFTHLLAA